LGWILVEILMSFLLLVYFPLHLTNVIQMTKSYDDDRLQHRMMYEVECLRVMVQKPY
jgi:hypothetical protein